MATATAADQLLQTTLAVKIYEGTPQQDSFEFEIASIHKEIALGARVHRLHKQIDPEWDEFSQGLDGLTLFNLRACAAFELLLKKSTAKWPWTETASGVVCDSSKFPAERADDVLLAYRGLLDALASFRAARITNAVAAGEQAVAVQPNPA